MSAAFHPCIRYSSYLVLPMAWEDDQEYPILSLAMASLPCQSFSVRHLHQVEWGDEIFAILPPCFGLDPSSPMEFKVEATYKLWSKLRNVTTPASVGAGVGYAFARLSRASPTNSLEGDMDECRLSLTDDDKIRFPSDEEMVSGRESGCDSGDEGNESPDSENERCKVRCRSYNGSLSEGSDSEEDDLKETRDQQLSRTADSGVGEGSGDASDVAGARQQQSVAQVTGILPQGYEFTAAAGLRCSEAEMQAYLDRLVTLADEQIAAVKNLDKNFSETSLIPPRQDQGGVHRDRGPHDTIHQGDDGGSRPVLQGRSGI